MKIEKISNNQYKLLKIQLIKSKVYKKNHQSKNLKLEDIEYRLKKILHIIYSYHINEKRILFVGNPLSINKDLDNILKNTKHIFIPKEVWVSGVMTNRYASISSLLNKTKNNSSKVSQKLIQLKKKSDLVVILDKEQNNNVLIESYIARIPVICLNSYLDTFDLKSSYKVPGNFISAKNNLTNNFFYSLLISTLKKATKVKRQFPSISYKLDTPKVLKKRFKRRFNKTSGKK